MSMNWLSSKLANVNCTEDYNQGCGIAFQLVETTGNLIAHSNDLVEKLSGAYDDFDIKYHLIEILQCYDQTYTLANVIKSTYHSFENLEQKSSLLNAAESASCSSFHTLNKVYEKLSTRNNLGCEVKDLLYHRVCNLLKKNGRFQLATGALSFDMELDTDDSSLSSFASPSPFSLDAFCPDLEQQSQEQNEKKITNFKMIEDEKNCLKEQLHLEKKQQLIERQQLQYERSMKQQKLEELQKAKEQIKLKEQQRLEEQRKLREQQKLEEQRKLKQQKIEEQRNLKQQQKLEEQRKLEEQKKLREQQKLEEQRKLKQQQKLEEQRKLEEQKKLVEQQKLEEQKKLKQQQKLDKQRKLKQQQNLEEQRLEEQRLEKQRLEEQRQLQKFQEQQLAKAKVLEENKMRIIKTQKLLENEKQNQLRIQQQQEKERRLLEQENQKNLGKQQSLEKQESAIQDLSPEKLNFQTHTVNWLHCSESLFVATQLISTSKFLDEFEKTALTFSRENNLTIDNVWEIMFNLALPPSHIEWAEKTLFNKNMVWERAKIIYAAQYPDIGDIPDANTEEFLQASAYVSIQENRNFNRSSLRRKISDEENSFYLNKGKRVKKDEDFSKSKDTEHFQDRVLDDNLQCNNKSKSDTQSLHSLHSLNDRTSIYAESLLSLRMGKYEKIDDYNRKFLRYSKTSGLDLRVPALSQRYINSILPKYSDIVQQKYNVEKNQIVHLVETLELAYYVVHPIQKSESITFLKPQAFTCSSCQNSNSSTTS